MAKVYFLLWFVFGNILNFLQSLPRNLSLPTANGDTIVIGFLAEYAQMRIALPSLITVVNKSGSVSNFPFSIDPTEYQKISKMEITSVTLYAIIVITSLLVYLYKRQYSYWKYRGIPHNESAFFYGSLKGLNKTKNYATIFREYYQKFKGTGPFAGFYFFCKPAAFVLDLDLVKNILIKDFSAFDDRGVFYNEKDDPLTAHLFALDGAKWRNLRNKISPTFTSGKMRFMFPTIVATGKEFATVFGETIDKSSVIEIKDLLERFTVDVIGTCAFGIDCNSLRNPKDKFRLYGKRAISENRHGKLMDGFMRSCPTLSAKLRLRRLSDDIHNFYMTIVRDTVKFRENNNVKRNDFMNLLIDLKNNKLVKSDSNNDMTSLTMNEIAAQAFVFFLAGFETSSTTMGFCLYELAQHQDVQDKLRKEVNDVLAKHNGEYTYDCMKEMHYLDQTIFETLRKYSVLANLVRRANRDYVTSDPKYVIEKGTTVIIPVDAIHKDPEYYPNPEVFDPDRFTPEEIAKRHPLTWLPFGDGPRNCIGLRFGKMQARIGISLLLKNYRFTTTEKTQIPLKFAFYGIVLSSESGIYLNVERV